MIKVNFAFQCQTLYILGNSKTSTYRVRLPIWQNEAALFVRELRGSTFHIWKSNLCS